MAPHQLERWGRDLLFRAQPAPTALLDPDLVLRAANPSYLSATASSEDQLLGQPMFEAFPDNPETLEAHSVANLQDSLERTIRRRRRDHMGLQRYDVPDRRNPGDFITKVWLPVNAPVLDGDDVIAVLHRVVEVTTASHGILRTLRSPAGGPIGRSAGGGVAWEGLAAALNECAALAKENAQLQEALTSRATIDQAKGMVMLHFRCTADDAFSLLTEVSQHTNVRLFDVAAALVHQAASGDASVLDMIRTTGLPVRATTA